MTIHIVGANGNMGRRYAVILDFLGIKYTGHDADEKIPEDQLAAANGIILATPTKCHVQDILYYSEFSHPMLCEKPITTNIHELDMIHEELEKVTMVNQYKYMIRNNTVGRSFYDYFKTGGDGLKWELRE